MLKFLFNIFVIYALWQLFKLIFSVNKAQKQFQEKYKDLNDRVNASNNQKYEAGKTQDKQGEYIDYEEIKD